MSPPQGTILGSAGSPSPSLSSSSEGFPSGHSAPPENVLARLRHSSLQQTGITPLQSQVDGLVTHFVHEAANPTTLAAIMAGGLAYRFGRIGIMAAGANATGRTATLVRGLSIAGGLGGEVSAFELTSRGLLTLSGDRSNPNLWSLRGQGGLLQGLASSTITFGMLKGAGHLAREQNIVFQHAFQSSAMVLGHNSSSLLGITPRPEGSLAEQLLHAEATNIQLGAGMSLVHTMAPGLGAFERGLDLSLSHVGFRQRPDARPVGGTHGEVPLHPHFAMATAGPEIRGRVEAIPSKLPAGRRESPLRNPNILLMEGPPEGGEGGGSGGEGGGKPISYAQRIHERLPLLAPSRISDHESHLRQEWAEWREGQAIDSAVELRLLSLLPQYTRFALAHLGRETPTHLPFIQEVFEMAAAEFQRDRGETLGESDRVLFLRFLNEQPGRRGGEFSLHSSSTPSATSRVSLETTRRVLGPTFETWENFLRTQTLSLPPSERARIFQRGLALMHFYGASLISRGGGSLSQTFREIPFQPKILERVLKEASAHPYPSESVDLFSRFFREELGQAETHASLVPRPETGVTDLDLSPLTLTRPPPIPPQPGENWTQYLTRLGVTRGQLDAADLSVAGATIFSWGSKEDHPGRLAPPGDILHLLSALHYLNERGSRNIDPLDAIRLTLPQQLSSFSPDGEGRIVIRYPALMQDLDYAHFRLGALLRSHIQSSGAHDMDLARQWDVSEGTVFDYRRGVVKKMRMDTLERLADSLAATPDARHEIMNLLMFLRYRPYFDATMTIADNDGNPLNRRPPLPSRSQIVLIPHGEALRPIDTTRRVRFEREPFASALNGTVDFSLDLLETRRREFELTGQDFVELREGPLSLTDYSRTLDLYRSRHTESFQLLSQHSASPGVVRPGQLREIQEFYRDLFRFFERVHLHTRPRGEIRLGERRVPFEIVPPTLEQPRGVRFQADPLDPKVTRSYVMAADLLENGQGLSTSMLRDLLHIRLARADLESQNLILPGEGQADTNRALLLRSLRSLPRFTENPEITWEDLIIISERLEQRAEQWSAPFVQPSEQAVLHRITRGRPQHPAIERRLLSWREDLQDFLARRGAASLTLVGEEALTAYLQAVPHPFHGFEAERLTEALAPLRLREGEASAEAVRGQLLDFMASLGFPTRPASPANPPSWSVEGFAQSVLATYVTRFHETHPLRRQGALIHDENLLDRVLNDRLTDAASLTPHRDRIAAEVKRLMEDYNRRNPPLTVYEVRPEGPVTTEPLPRSPLEALYQSALAESASPDSISQRLIYAALREVENSWARGESPTQHSLAQALEESRTKLNGVVPAPQLERQPHLELLGRLVGHIERGRQAIQNLALDIPSFVERKRYQSGLEDSRALGEDLQRIFRRYFNMALINPAPLPLRQVILESLSGRFGPYSSIREDVIRGLSIVSHDFLRGLQREAQQMDEGLGLSLSYAREHRDLEKFWQNSLEWAQSENPRIRNREALIRHLEDLDLILSLLSPPSSRSLSALLRNAVVDIERWAQEAPSIFDEVPPPLPPSIEQIEPPPPPPLSRQLELPIIGESLPEPQTISRPPPPIDLPRLLSSPLMPGHLERYPELGLVEEEALRLQVTDERRHLAEPEGRPLFHLFALFKEYEGRLASESREIIENLVLEAETSSEPLPEIVRRAFEDYDRIRLVLMNQIPLFDRVGLLPEIRGNQERLSGPEAGRAVQRLMSQRDLTSDLMKKWANAVESHHPLILQGQREAYWERAAQFYWDHREALLRTRVFHPQDEDSRPLDLNSPPARLRQRLEREAPELDLFGDPHLREALQEAQNLQPGLIADFWSQGGSYLLLKIRCLFANYFRDLPSGSPLIQVGQDFLHHYRRLTALADAGSSLPHLAVRGTDQLLEFYRRQRPVLLKHLFEREGRETLLATFPEIRNPEEIASPGSTEDPMSPPHLSSTQGFSRAANHMLGHASNSRTRRNLEQLLWNFSPPTEQTPPEEADSLLNTHMNQIARYYLDHRQDFSVAVSAGEGWERESSSSSGSIDRLFWELQTYPLSSAELRQEGMGSALQKSASQEPHFIFRYHGPDRAIHEKLVSTEEASRIHERFIQGEGVRFQDHQDLLIGPQDKTFTILITPFYRARLYLGSRMPLDLFRLTEFISLPLGEVLFNEVQRDLDRAAALILMGVNEGWVLSTLRPRLIRTYEKYREQALEKLDYSGTLEGLPEILSIPTYEVENWKQAQRLRSSTVTFDQKDELLARMVAIIESRGFPEKLRDLFNKRMRAAHQRSQDSFQVVSRFYLEHREEFLGTLRPWVEVPIQWIEEVRDYPEMREIGDEEAQLNGGVDLPRKLRATDAFNLPFLRIAAILNRDEVPAALREQWDQMLKRIPGQSTGAITAAAVRFYREHREEILPHLTPR